MMFRVADVRIVQATLAVQQGRGAALELADCVEEVLLKWSFLRGSSAEQVEGVRRLVEARVALAEFEASRLLLGSVVPRDYTWIDVSCSDSASGAWTDGLRDVSCGGVVLAGSPAAPYPADFPVAGALGEGTVCGTPGMEGQECRKEESASFSLGDGVTADCGSMLCWDKGLAGDWWLLEQAHGDALGGTGCESLGAMDFQLFGDPGMGMHV